MFAQQRRTRGTVAEIGGEREKRWELREGNRPPPATREGPAIASGDALGWPMQHYRHRAYRPARNTPPGGPTGRSEKNYPASRRLENACFPVNKSPLLRPGAKCWLRCNRYGRQSLTTNMAAPFFRRCPIHSAGPQSGRVCWPSMPDKTQRQCPRRPRPRTRRRWRAS